VEQSSLSVEVYLIGDYSAADGALRIDPSGEAGQIRLEDGHGPVLVHGHVRVKKLAAVRLPVNATAVVDGLGAEEYESCGQRCLVERDVMITQTLCMEQHGPQSEVSARTQLNRVLFAANPILRLDNLFRWMFVFTRCFSFGLGWFIEVLRKSGPRGTRKNQETGEPRIARMSRIGEVTEAKGIRAAPQTF
jgi:hypothetical protein